MTETAKEYFVLSVNHTTRESRFILLWNPNNAGYCNRLHVAGRYTEEQIRGSMHYYNDGCANIAVPCEVLESMTVPAPDGWFDTNGGDVVENNRANWLKAIKGVIESPQFKPRPEYPRSRKVKEAV
ncbi:hypothetical protein [Ewingella americana]|uniref:hypothetical protein n=1 Tax=Ewingella americana TaxID=41202 RepID=UPI00163B2682|nr:hypothetical protein [Ewingella americana]QMV50925.1 hypothetical protein GXP68_05840 [Ewingella americana]